MVHSSVILKIKNRIKSYFVLIYFLKITILRLHFYEITNQAKIVDDKLIDDAAINIKLAATLANQDLKGNFRNPERGIVRFQMMEVPGIMAGVGADCGGEVRLQQSAPHLLRLSRRPLQDFLPHTLRKVPNQQVAAD